ncbi:SUMF1/EgtB/PvdO family nonheme iron enzyme [Enterobacter cloacae]|uniref:formylglycine-generating enzyme family protein n=1 Tax=Enterobacter cloacae TaxID=550 RepID=UPI002FD006E2
MTGQILSHLTLITLVLVAITGCRDEQNIKADSDALVRTSLENLVTVKGGSFQMGDFGRLVDEHLPFNPDQDTPLHSVTLSDFRIGKYRVTWGEFNRWLVIQGRDKNTIYQTISQGKYFSKQDKEALGETYPATASWQDARDYCQWLGKNTHRNMDLPTEAQWEYAARSRGRLFIFANADNKNYVWNDKNRNYASSSKKKPVGSFPANPLGLYDMMGNGADWVKDWYAADYYLHSPEKDPQGPESGKKKSVRGSTGSGHTLSIERSSLKPDSEWGSEFRCVENSPLK